MRRQILAAALVVMVAGATASAGDAVGGTFSAPADRLWTVTLAVLRQLGWDIDKADRDIGWITTDSRKVDGEDYGVYAKGTRHRLRIIVKGAGAGKTTVSVERMLFRRERILFVDNDEPLPTTDHSVEQAILAAIAKGL
jgi:hypothetical protein